METSLSLNDGAIITDRKSFEEYNWPDADKAEGYDILADAAGDLPDGMKIITGSPGGVLENAIKLTGYDDLCILSIEDEGFTGEIFREVGSCQAL